MQRVLVVDDNPVNLKVASAMLSRLGYPHETVATGELALKAIAEAHRSDSPFPIVLLDSHMPVMDGQMTAEAIKAQWGAQAPVMIGISASTLGEDRQRCLAAGMSDYLPKPLELKRLADTLTHWCQPELMKCRVARQKTLYVTPNPNLHLNALPWRGTWGWTCRRAS